MYSALFELHEASAKVSSFNPRAEMHGNEREKAGDLRFELAMAAADVLPMFSPELHAALYCRHDTQVDLASKGTDGLVNLKFPKLGPLKWEREIVGATLTIHQGISAKANLVIDGCIVNNFALSPSEGGTVIVSFRVQRSKLDEKQCGRLCQLVQEQVDISLAPPEGGGESKAPTPDADE